MAQDARWFSAGALVKKDKSDNTWKVLVRTSDQSPAPRFLGGCEEAGDTSPEMTLVREFLDESRRYKPAEYEEVFCDSFPGHDKKLYLVIDVEGEVDFSYTAEGKEPDGEYIYVKWMALSLFRVEARGFHKKAIDALVKKMANTDSSFAMDHLESLPRWSENKQARTIRISESAGPFSFPQHLLFYPLK